MARQRVLEVTIRIPIADNHQVVEDTIGWRMRMAVQAFRKQLVEAGLYHVQDQPVEVDYRYVYERTEGDFVIEPPKRLRKVGT